jgi:hypothetical protein
VEALSARRRHKGHGLDRGGRDVVRMVERIMFMRVTDRGIGDGFVIVTMFVDVRVFLPGSECKESLPSGRLVVPTRLQG